MPSTSHLLQGFNPRFESFNLFRAKLNLLPFHISNIFATDWLIATYGLKKSARMLDDLLDSLASNVRVTGISSYCYDLPL